MRSVETRPISPCSTMASSKALKRWEVRAKVRVSSASPGYTDHREGVSPSIYYEYEYDILPYCAVLQCTFGSSSCR